MKALNDFIIMQELEDQEEVSKGGFILSAPSDVTELVAAQVVSFGPQTKHVNGDSEVYVFRQMCREMRIDGITYLVTAEENLLAVL